METVWLLLGIAVLGATLLDVFLTALNFDEAGFIAGPLTRIQWRLLRRATRRLPRRWRPVALRQVTGLQIVTIVAAWLFGVISGFGLIYYALMSGSAFSVSGQGAGLTLFDAMYFSAAQLSTVGGSSLTAETDLLRFLSISETLSGVILVSLILTFLLGVYSVIGDLNALCRHFFTAERGAGSATASLAPFFRDGEPSGLDGHLDGVAASFSSYVDGIRLHHAAYYFQSGRDQFALPYAVRMLAGTLGALRWGLPTGHPASTEPGLVPLTFQFLEFGEYLERTVRLRNLAVPEVVSAERFARVARERGRDPEDVWVARFVQVDASMAALAKLEPLADLDDAYRRYSEWLPFAFRAEQITLAVSDDLDYQPVIVSDRPVSILQPEDAIALGTVRDDARPVSLAAPAGDAGRPGLSRWRAFVGGRLAQTDPGHGRLRSAARAVLAAGAAVASLYVAFDVAGREAVEPAAFGGLVAMLSTGAAIGSTQRERQVTSVLILVPIAALVMLGSLVSDSRLLTGILVVAVAAAGVWAARFGPRWAAVGRLSFMAYYFALILRLRPDDAALCVAAGVVGAAWAFLLNYVIIPDRPAAVLRSGIADCSRFLVTAMDSLLDAVSWARWDAEIRKHAAVDVRQLRRHIAFLGGQLTRDESATGVPAERAIALRLRLFDTELAYMRLVAAVRQVTGTAISLEVRGRLAGRIELLQAHLAALAAEPAEAGPESARGLAPWSDSDPPAQWPRPARVLDQAIDELHRVAGQLRAATAAALDPSVSFAAPLSADADGGPEAASPTTASTDGAEGAGSRPQELAPTTRRAFQVAVATAASLAIGWLVSTTHQYWATLSAYQVLGETDGETFVKGARRVAGTVAGAIVGFGVALSEAANPEVILPLLAVAVFASTYYRQVSPGVQTFWTTMIFALLYETLGGLTTIALELRVLETVVGAVIALAVAYLVLPTHTRAALSKDCTALVEDVDAIVGASMGRLAGDPASTVLPEIRERLLAADQHVRRIGGTAAPLRFAAGSLGDGGIEGRLTAAWSLTNHTRSLVRATEHAIELGVSPADQEWRALGRATSENVAALSAALAGRLPGPVEPDVGAFEADGTEPASGAVEAVMRELSQVNQTLLAMLDDVSPGAVGDADPAGRAGG